jgi:diguanylate cyclase (GGDEF)-like protein
MASTVSSSAQSGREAPPTNARPAEAFLICSSEFQIVYYSKGLAPMLQIPPGSASLNSLLLPLLASSPVIDDISYAAIMARFNQAMLARAEASHDFLSLIDHQPIHLQIQRVGDAHWILSFEDLGARREAENDVAKLAFTDALTGLGNRLRFRQSLTLALSEGMSGTRRLALLLIDLDRFKAVNDTLGHPVGDQLLRKVAERLHTVVRQKDMLARLGGDEFAVWIPTSVEDSDGLARLGARIVDLLGRPFLIEGHQVNIGASVGIAVAPPDGSDYESLTKSADLALYSAKAAGRNLFHFFDAAMERRAQDRRRLELDLRRALALRQFELHFRPQVDVETRTLFGLEALLRWRHPERGLLDPASFLSLAEEIALVVPIGRWMLEAACRQAASWPAEIKLVVAVSSPQFDSGSLVDCVKHALAVSKLDPARLEIEITERVLLSNETNVVKTLYELRAVGVRIGISNFGTGYASLTKLDSFPFDRIKMDTSLVEDEAASHRAIVTAVVAFGTSLGVSTMVDGIRTLDQLAKLRMDGGRAVQGFLSAPTVSPVELDEFFKRPGG